MRDSIVQPSAMVVATDASAVTPASKLVALAEQVTAEHNAVLAAGQKTIQHAINVGLMLIDAKAACRHGEFQAWLATTGVPARSAQRYMRVARNRDNPKCVSVSHLTEALDALVERDVDADLPEPLAILLNSGELSQEHIDVLYSLRDFYGDTAVDLSHWRKCAPDICCTDKAVTMFLVAIRPEDVPPSLVMFAWENSIVSTATRDACRSLDKLMRDGSYRVPGWIITAFWFAAQALDLGLEPDLLAISISGWKERILSAVCYSMMYADRPEADKRAFFGYKADLRHAGVGDWWDNPPDRVKEAALNMALDAGSICDPSSLQRWALLAGAAE